MKAIKIYTQESKFYMEDLHTNVTTEINEFVDDGKTLKLPENSANRTYCAVKKALEGVTLDYKESRTIKSGERTTRVKSKIDLNEYYTDEERAKIEKLQAQIDKINEAVTKRAEQKMAEQTLIDNAMGLTIEQLEAIMAAKKAEAKA